MASTTVGFFTKLAYGVGQVAEAIKNSSFELFLFFYYTQVLGLSGTLAGAALFIALCVDGITDPVIGALSDGWRSRWGRRHPLMYISAIPLALCFYYLFAPPSGLGQPALFAWLYGPGAGVIGLVAILVFSGYDLTRARTEQVQSELKTRRAAAN